jgi:hypothetical protein
MDMGWDDWGLEDTTKTLMEFLEKWHTAALDGTANMFWHTILKLDGSNLDGEINKERADNLVDYIDGYTDNEIRIHKSWGAKGVDMPSQFNKLNSGARLAFLQQTLELRKSLYGD